MSTSPSEGLFIGFILDGNRRQEVEDLATVRGQTLTTSQLSFRDLVSAYTKGGEAVRGIMETARDGVVGTLALWAWSEENMTQRGAEVREATFAVIDSFLGDLEHAGRHDPASADVRLVHMGRTDRLSEADPVLLARIQRLCAETRERAGMVVALCCDYSGPQEADRAIRSWAEAGAQGDWRQYLDLPRQGVPFRPLDLLVRTGEDGGGLVHDNAFLHGYRNGQTEMAFTETLLPHFTQDMFRAYLQRRLEAKGKRRGGK
ncbi:MAG: undecaprenyl diphosphate synthase family protein [Candidatus Peribacteraceae bacterium]|nr:undecaprenyl diphosphate synthase family protein [Candidatus Peribacteraceae bacterium]